MTLLHTPPGSSSQSWLRKGGASTLAHGRTSLPIAVGCCGSCPGIERHFLSTVDTGRKDRTDGIHLIRAPNTKPRSCGRAINRAKASRVEGPANKHNKLGDSLKSLRPSMRCLLIPIQVRMWPWHVWFSRLHPVAKDASHVMALLARPPFSYYGKWANTCANHRFLVRA